MAGACSQEKSGVISKTTTRDIYKPEPVKANKDRLAELNMPDGLKISKFAEGLGKTQMMTVSPEVIIYRITNKPK